LLQAQWDRGELGTSLITTNGQMNEFQLEMKLNTASTARLGRASGSITERNVRTGPAPSTRAASSSSWGMVRKNCRSRNAPKRGECPRHDERG